MSGTHLAVARRISWSSRFWSPITGSWVCVALPTTRARIMPIMGFMPSSISWP